MGLTRDVDSDPRRQALAAALSEFARRAELTLVAEGIETEQELHTLRSIGPMLGQGYLFARPEPASTFVSS